MSKIEQRLADLGITLPTPMAPVANYVPFVISGNLLHISGQVSTDADGGVKGTVGQDVDFDTAVKGADGQWRFKVRAVRLWDGAVLKNFPGRGTWTPRKRPPSLMRK